MQRVAAIIDYPRTDLDQTIWVTDGETIALQPDIKLDIEDIVASFLDDLHLPSEALLDVLIYGSILTNQYNSKTDVDARIILNPQVVKDRYPRMTGDDLYEMSLELIHDVKLGKTDHPFNATVIVAGDQTELSKSPLGITDRDPVFSFKQNKLLKPGKMHDESFDPDEEFAIEKEETTQIMDRLDKILQETKTNTVDHELIEEAVSEVKDPQRLIHKMEEKLSAINDNLSELTEEYKKLRDDRNQSYRTAPVDDRHKAPGNVKYKLLERYRYIDLLKKLKRIFEGGVDDAEVADVAETLKMDVNVKKAFPYDQRGPAKIELAPQTDITMPPLDTNPNAIEEGGGSFMHGGSTNCPRCGKENITKASEDGKEIKCDGCGKHYSKDSVGYSLSTAPSTGQYSTPYEGDMTIYHTSQVDPKNLPQLLQTMKDMGVSEDAIKNFQQQMNSTPGKPPAGGVQPVTDTTQAPSSQNNPVPEVQKSPTDKNIHQKPAKPLTQVMLGKEPTSTDRVKAAIRMLRSVSMDHTIVNRPISLFGDGVPGKDPGDSPYSDTGKALAEGKNETGKHVIEEEEALPMEVITVLEGIDILPYLTDDKLIEQLLAQFPMLGDPSKKIDRQLAATFNLSALGTEPPEGTGQYIGPTMDPNYDETPHTQLTPEVAEEWLQDHAVGYYEDELDELAVQYGMDPWDMKQTLKEYADDLMLATPRRIAGETESSDEVESSTESSDGVESSPESSPESSDDVESSGEGSAEMSEEVAKWIGTKIGIKWDEVDFTPAQLLVGIDHEFEHGTKDPETNVTDDDVEETAKIAWVHLKEDKDYYEKLDKLEGSQDMTSAHMVLCPNCGSIQKTDTNCSICKKPITESHDTPEEASVLPPKRAQHQKQKQKRNLLDRKTKTVINDKLGSSGLDGNGRFEEPGKGLSVALDILHGHGLVPAEVLNAFQFSQDSGHQNISLESVGSPDDPFTPGAPLENAMLVISWSKFEETGMNECLAYV